MQDLLNKILTETTGTGISSNSFASVSGGSINQAWKVETDQGAFLIKTNEPDAFPGMFEAEVKGLQLLKQKSLFRIPEIKGVFKNEEVSALVMEFIQPGTPSPDFWNNFGSKLANLHLQSDQNFGLDHHNYIGSLAQHNSPTGTWPEFFIINRLEKLLQNASDLGKLGDRSLIRNFNRLFPKLGDIFPEEPPALLHGDLWSGNFLTDETGDPVLIDSAVYYGHREMDLAMTSLFGGFGRHMYEQYQNEYPLEKGWEERVEICNLYPLLVHAILFGENYLWQLKQIMKKF